MDVHLSLSVGTRASRSQLERELREGIRSGRLAPGTVLPSSRVLASEQGISRGVVVEAYSQLIAEGYLVARQGAETRVAPGVQTPSRLTPEPPARKLRYDLRPSLPDVNAFPRRSWLAATARVVRELPNDRLGYGDPRGAPELRTALASYLGRARGVVARPEQIVVCNGLRQGLALLWQALARRGVRRVGVEDPGWRGQRETLSDAGIEAVPIPVDEQGLVTEGLDTLDIAAVVVTPAHQFPSGAVLAAERRGALMSWARRHDALIVEDDYDAQYRYDREPIGAIQGLAPDQTAHGGSVSKILAPALRLGWLILPADLVDPVARAKARADHGSPLLEQLVLAEMLEHGDLDRHLRRTRRVYGRRREVMLRALAQHLPDVTVEGAAAGLHLVARLAPSADEAAIVALAEERGIAVEGLGSDEPALLLGYGALSEQGIPRAVRTLAAVLDASR